MDKFLLLTESNEKVIKHQCKTESHFELHQQTILQNYRQHIALKIFVRKSYTM